MIGHTAKLAISFSLSALAVVLFVTMKGQERKLCMIAMLISSFGDIFMTDSFHMGDASVVPGAAGFIIAHIVYAVCFIGASRKKGYKVVNPAFLTGAGLTVAAGAALYVLMMKKCGSLQTMYPLLMIYLLIIGLNLSSQFSYASNDGGCRLLLIAGMTLFLISDFVVFLPMLNICHEHNDFVWLTYGPAQLLIILCNSAFRRQSSLKT